VTTADRAQTRLAEMRAGLERSEVEGYYLRTDLGDALLAVVEGVLGLHRRSESPGYCTCEDFYPCETRALVEELLGGES